MNKKIKNTIIFASIGIICFIIYALVNKINILSFLISGEALFIYLVLVIAVALIGTAIWKKKILGDDDDDEV